MTRSCGRIASNALPCSLLWWRLRERARLLDVNPYALFMLDHMPSWTSSPYSRTLSWTDVTASPNASRGLLRLLRTSVQTSYMNRFASTAVASESLSGLQLCGVMGLSGADTITPLLSVRCATGHRMLAEMKAFDASIVLDARIFWIGALERKFKNRAVPAAAFVLYDWLA